MTRLPVKTRGPVRREAASAESVASLAPPHRSTIDAVHEPNLSHSGSPKLLRFPAVRDRSGLSRSTIWRLERRGAFPRHHRISANAVAWVEDDIANWIRRKISDIAV